MPTRGRIAKHNRKVARNTIDPETGEHFTNVTEAREAGIDLPDNETKKLRKALRDDAEAQAQNVPPEKKPTKK